MVKIDITIGDESFGFEADATWSEVAGFLTAAVNAFLNCTCDGEPSEATTLVITTGTPTEQ